MIDIQKMFLAELEWNFLFEIAARTFCMFFLIILILRISGRRGVRQLTLFEVAIIIGLGSAAGDPMFQSDIPILHAIVVFTCVISFYKLLTFLASRFKTFTNLLEGKPMIIIKDGRFEMKHENDNTFSKMEFFAELRNKSVEHLGQVKLGVLEVDGTLSLLFYKTIEIREGLPIFPTGYVEIDSVKQIESFACMYCGNVVGKLERVNAKCDRCSRDKWATTMRTHRVT